MAIAEELVRLSVPFLLVTGYGAGVNDPPVIMAAPRLQKPFTEDDLARRMTEAFLPRARGTGEATDLIGLACSGAVLTLRFILRWVMTGRSPLHGRLGSSGSTIGGQLGHLAMASSSAVAEWSRSRVVPLSKFIAVNGKRCYAGNRYSVWPEQNPALCLLSDDSPRCGLWRPPRQLWPFARRRHAPG